MLFIWYVKSLPVLILITKEALRVQVTHAFIIYTKDQALCVKMHINKHVELKCLGCIEYEYEKIMKLYLLLKLHYLH